MHSTSLISAVRRCLRSLRAPAFARPECIVSRERTARRFSVIVLATTVACACGYVGLDSQDNDTFVPGETGGTNTGGTGTGGLQEPLPSGGQSNTGGASGGMTGLGGDVSWGGFGGLGGYGGAGGPCEEGDVCDFVCLQSPCRVDCPANSTCETESQDVSVVITRCREGAVCQTIGSEAPSLLFVCQGPGDCQSDCREASQCSAQCVGTGSCDLKCQGSDCSVHCSSASECMMVGGAADKHICAGIKQYCANGVTTCNRPCP